MGALRMHVRRSAGPALASGLVAALAAACSAAPGGSHLARVPATQRLTAYVLNSGSDTVTPVRLDHMAAGKAIAVGRYPIALTYSAASRTVYVASDLNPLRKIRGIVTPISTSSHLAGRPVPVGTQPFAITAIPGGTIVYVSSGGPPRSVVPIGAMTNSPGKALRGGGPIAVTADGAVAYIVTGIGTVRPLDTATGALGKAIQAGRGPALGYVTSTGRTLYVVHDPYPNHAVPGYVTPIRISTGSRGRPIWVGVHPDAIVAAPGAGTLYVANVSSGSVTPVSMSSNSAGRPIQVGQYPSAMAITPDGKTVYVVNAGSGTVTPITVATDTAGQPIMVGQEPNSIAITPDGSLALVTNFGSNTVTPIWTATNSTGPAVRVGSGPEGLVIAP